MKARALTSSSFINTISTWSHRDAYRRVSICVCLSPLINVEQRGISITASCARCPRMCTRCSFLFLSCLTSIYTHSWAHTCIDTRAFARCRFRCVYLVAYSQFCDSRQARARVGRIRPRSCDIFCQEFHTQDLIIYHNIHFRRPTRCRWLFLERNRLLKSSTDLFLVFVSRTLRG